MDGPVFLFPLDGSNETEKALGLATRTIKALPGVTVRLLIVEDAGFQEIPDEVREGMDLDPTEHEVFQGSKQLRAVVDRAKGIVASAGLKTEVHIRSGKPFDLIIEESKLADVLVMHQLRRTQLRERLSGSMTERIARSAHCHVLLIDTEHQRVVTGTPNASASAE